MPIATRKALGVAKPTNSERFFRASSLWEAGEHRQAFLVFLEGAKCRDESSQVCVGYFYDEGIGVRKNVAKALYWYRRAFRNGSAFAGANVGLILRARGDSRRAIEWFKRAFDKGDKGSGLFIGQAYAAKDAALAVKYLRAAAAPGATDETTQEQATTLLEELRRAPKRPGKWASQRPRTSVAAKKRRQSSTIPRHRLGDR